MECWPGQSSYRGQQRGYCVQQIGHGREPSWDNPGPVKYRGDFATLGAIVNRWWLLLAVAPIAAVGFAAGFLVHVPVNSLWIPVIAALGASFLTALAGIGVEYVRERSAAHAQEKLQRRDAYERLLMASAQFIELASTIRVLRGLTSGITPSVRVSDSMSLLDRFVRETHPLRDAWSQVWFYGSREAIMAANQLITTTTPAITLATAGGKGRSPLLALIAGEKWTSEQDKEFGQALQKVGLARMRFGEAARRELGAATVDLLLGTDQTPTAEHQSALA